MKVLLIGMALVAAALVGAAVATVLQDQDDDQRRQASASPGRPTTATASPAPTPEPSPVYQSTDDLKPGDCFEAIEDADDGSVLAGRVVACDLPHREEVFGVTNHPAGPGAPYPGDETMRDWAESHCDELFEPYVGVPFQESTLTGSTITPLRDSWDLGDRHVICTVVAPAQGTLTKSVRGTGR